MEFLSRLHPLIIHFPIAFLFVYAFLELIGLVIKKDYLSTAALIILLLGVLFAVAAVTTGNQALEIIRHHLKNHSRQIIETINEHEQFATVTLWYFAALVFLRIYLTLKKVFNYKWKVVCSLLGLIGCFLIIKTGLIGGKLVYEFGIGTKLFLMK